MSENIIGILILFVMYSLQAFIDKSASNHTNGNAATMGYGVAKNFTFFKAFLIISYLVFKEKPTKRMLLGCLIVLSAVLLL